MVDNLAVIDQEKCKKCGLCAQKCPRKTIEKVKADQPHSAVSIGMICFFLDMTPGRKT